VAIETINLGTPNARDGDTVREAFRKINGNFVEFATELGGINNAINTLITDGINANIDLSAVAQNIFPSVDNVYSLGSAEKRWKDIYVGPGSLYVGGVKIELDPATNSLSIVNAQTQEPIKLVVGGTVNAINPSTGVPVDLTPLPEGGIPGQFLAKLSNTDYDVEWVDPNLTITPATTTTLGGVIVGANINVTVDGTISVPVATTSALGVVKAGTNVNIDEFGSISVSKGAGINTVKDIPDVNSTAGGAALNDGALLIYNASSERWDTVQSLRSNEMDGGFF
jgi:hypothetical protein